MLDKLRERLKKIEEELGQVLNIQAQATQRAHELRGAHSEVSTLIGDLEAPKVARSDETQSEKQQISSSDTEVPSA